MVVQEDQCVGRVLMRGFSLVAANGSVHEVLRLYNDVTRPLRVGSYPSSRLTAANNTLTRAIEYIQCGAKRCGMAYTRAAGFVGDLRILGNRKSQAIGRKWIRYST